MSNVRDHVKETLGAIEPLQRKLQAYDQTHNEIDDIGKLFVARKDELAAVEAQLEKTRKEAAKADDQHAHWVEVNTRERSKGNSANDEIQRQNELLTAQNKELRAEQQNILDGISALRQRLKVPANV